MDFKDHVNKELLVNIINAIPSNIFFKDTDQKYVFSSHYSDQLNFGEDGDIYGKTDREIRKNTKNLELTEAMDREILDTGTGRQYVIKSEKDGNAVYLEVIKEPVKDENGNIIGIVGVTNDVTKATKEVSDVLEKAAAEAAILGKAKDQFFANTSHEIRTPMNAVIGMAEVLLRDETDPQKIDYLKNIKAAGTHLLGIINNILDVSKIESGKLEIIPEAYEIRPRLELLQKLLNERSKEKNLELIMEVDDRLPKLMYGDPVRIRQVIINLANNAIKFTEKGFVKVIVRVEEITDTEVMEYICVEDSGIGIKEEDMDKIFGAFNRINEEKTVGIEGIGLGLALSKHLVELMGGQIQVESEYGVGTKFYFTIKQGLVKEPEIKEKEEHNQKKEKAGMKFKAPKAKVLVADDSAVNLKVFKALVAPLELQVDTAENGKIAVEMVEKNYYDIVFMDHMMPVMDGVEAMKNIRQLDSDKRDIKIIALTANAVVGVKEQLIESGMDDFISKPIRIKELLEIFRKYLPEEYIEEKDS